MSAPALDHHELCSLLIESVEDITSAETDHGLAKAASRILGIEITYNGRGLFILGEDND